jgi:hypothetical protein
MSAQPSSAKERFFSVLRTRKVTITAFLGLCATIISGVAGAVISSYFERASPAILLSDVTISSNYNKRFDEDQIVKVPLSDALFGHLAESNWMRSIREPSLKLKDITERLDLNANRVDLFLKDAAAFREAMPRLKTLLAAPAPSLVTAEAFFDQWEKVDDFVLGAIEGQIIQGKFSNLDKRNYASKAAYLQFRETMGDGVPNFTISKRGSKFISVIAFKRASSDDGRAIAEALIHFDQEMLGKYLDTVASELLQYALHEGIQREVTEYKKAYSRWIVSTLISNYGHRPVSFSPSGSVYVNSRGTSLGNDYTVIDIENRNQNGERDPITVEGGQSKIIAFASPSLVLADEKWRQLIGLFESASRGCFIVLHPQSDIWSQSDDLKSSVRVFGPSKSGQRLTDQEIKMHFGQ